MDFADVSKICYDYTINGIANMAALANKPFRFVYTSGVLIERDQNKFLPFLSDYRRLRVRFPSIVLFPILLTRLTHEMQGRVENYILDFAKQHEPNVQVTVAKPGAIEGPNREAVVSALMKNLASMFGYAPKVHVSEIAAAMIDQCLNGVTKDPLWSNELAEIGQRLLRKEDYLV